MTTLADKLLLTGAVAACPAAAATATLPGARWRAPDRVGSGLQGRDHLHGPHLYPLGAVAGRRVRLRQCDDLLAPLRRVGQSGVFEQL
jgi:hypothetical protein